MSKMTNDLIQSLYSLGKKVYNHELSMSDAKNRVITEYGSFIAESSAEFYLGLVKDLINGKGSTWNQNSDLLVYYVDHITKDFGAEAGANAYKGGMKFALSKSRKPLIDALEQVKEKYNLGDEIGTSQEAEDDMEGNNREIAVIIQYIKNKGFQYDDELIENFFLCLKTKPFVILAGTSGTGKTKLVKLFSEAIGAEYKLVSVRPDWSDSSDLFGYTNLHGVFESGAITKYVRAAIDNPNKPYVLCLDEMNLARVEYYFSDFLSLIETRKRVDGRIITDPISIDDAGREKYGTLYLPDNLYFIGTVNMDETTYPFSKKVLDRANTIEFSDVEFLPLFNVEKKEDKTIVCGNDFLATKYLTLMTDIDESQRTIVTKICTELQAINKILRKANAHVGYRVRDEIVFYMLNNDEYKLLEYENALDFEIMQKILPRIQGSTQSIKDLLVDLFQKCAGDYSAFSQDLIWMQMNDYLNNKASIYPKSAEKICYMMRRFEEDGFTSYWL